MKKTLLLLAFVSAAWSAQAQQPSAKPAPAAVAAPAGYAEMLAATITELTSTGDPAQLKLVIAKLERAATAAPTDWLPLYYQAYGRVLLSFVSKEADDVKDAYLDQAEAALAQVRKVGVGDESELLVLQAYVYQARLSIVPMMRSMIYSKKVNDTLEQAKKLNPANPRIYLVQANNLYYTPKMFGGGAEAAKPVYDEAKARYAAFKPAALNDPNWGARQLQSRLKKYDEAAVSQAAK